MGSVTRQTRRRAPPPIISTFNVTTMGAAWSMAEPFDYKLFSDYLQIIVTDKTALDSLIHIYIFQVHSNLQFKFDNDQPAVPGTPAPQLPPVTIIPAPLNADYAVRERHSPPPDMRLRCQMTSETLTSGMCRPDGAVRWEKPK